MRVDLSRYSGGDSRSEARCSPDPGAQESRRCAAQHSSTDGTGGRAAEATSGEYVPERGRVGVARAAASSMDGDTVDGGSSGADSGTDDDGTSVKQYREKGKCMYSGDGKHGARSPREWRTTLRKRREAEGGGAAEQRSRKRRKASDQRVPKVERHGGIERHR